MRLDYTMSCNPMNFRQVRFHRNLRAMCFLHKPNIPESLIEILHLEVGFQFTLTQRAYCGTQRAIAERLSYCFAAFSTIRHRVTVLPGQMKRFGGSLRLNFLCYSAQFLLGIVADCGRRSRPAATSTISYDTE